MTLATLISTVKKQYQNKLPFVLYRKPNSSTVKALLQPTTVLEYVSSAREPGFVFAPFLKEEKKILFKKEGAKFLEVSYDSTSFLTLNKTKPIHANIVKDKKEKERYTDLITKAVADITNSTLQKVVLSRVEKQAMKIAVFDVFIALIQQYANACCSIWYHPKVGLWIGATPEVLFKYKNGVFNTMALAGTQAYNGSLEVDWGKKEIEEQQLVTDYILAALQNLASNIEVSKVETIKAANLLHLRTLIKGNIKKETITTVVDKLHPTPAICGLPLEEALHYVLENENYDRTYYAGYFGEYFIEADEVSLFVNLRCLSIVDDLVSIFVGGGITAFSDPLLEWEETVKKTMTLKSVLV